VRQPSVHSAFVEHLLGSYTDILVLEETTASSKCSWPTASGQSKHPALCRVWAS